MGNWYSKSAICKRFLYLNQFFRKKPEIVSGKNSFFVITLLVLPIEFVLTLAFKRTVLYGNVELSFAKLKYGTPVFKKSFSFSENLFLIQGIGNMPFS